MFKRIGAFILVFLLCVSLCTVMPTFAASDSDMKLLQDLGIIDMTEKTGFFAKGFTRGDFAASMCAALFEDKNPEGYAEEGVRYAEDIDNNKNYNAIVAMLKLGYMQTDGSGNFRPSADLTYKDAVYALVSALGYKPLAQNKGGRDSDYLAVASKIGLLKGVTIEDAEKLTAAEVGEMLTNAMGIKILAEGDVNLNGICLWDKMEIVKSQGKILANSNLGLMVERAERNHINIDGNIYYTELYVKDEEVGSEVIFYTQKGDFGTEVISIYNLGNDETVTVESSEIESIEYENRRIIITDKKGEDIEFLKNGYAVVNNKTVTPDVSLFNALKSGMVTFVDSDGDGVYDIAHITILKQSIIDGVNFENEAILTRFDNETITLKDAEDYYIYLDDETADITELKKGMVVGIACDAWTISGGEISYDYAQAKVIKLYASATTAEGTVTMFTSDSVNVGDMSVTLGSTYKTLVDGGHISALRIGDYVVLYQDVLGEVVYYEVDVDNSTMQYGYLIAADVSDEGFDDKNEFKIMNTSGKVNLFSTDKSFVLDGEKVTAGSLSYPVGEQTVDFTKRQLVRYGIENGVLKKLDTEAVRPGKEDEKTSLYETMAFDPYAADQPSRDVSNSVIDYRYGFKEGVIVFYDEAQMTDLNPAENKFSVEELDEVSSGDYYMAGYNANDTGLLSVAVIYRMYGVTEDSSRSKFYYYGHNGHMVSKITQSINKDGVEGWTLKLAGDSGTSDYFIDPEILSLRVANPEDNWGVEYVTMTTCDSYQLESVLGVGDVVRFGKNAGGEVNYLERIFDFSLQGADEQTKAREPLGGQTYAFVKVEKTDGDYIIYSEGTDDNRLMKLRSIYSAYSVYNVKTGKTTIVDTSQIPSASTGAEVRMYSRFYDGVGLEHIFYVFE